MQIATAFIAITGLASSALAAPSAAGLAPRQGGTTNCILGDNDCPGLQDCIEDESKWPSGTQKGQGKYNLLDGP
jgi:hypothetical protein